MAKHKNLWLLISCIIAGLLLFTSCGGSDTTSTTATSTTTTTAPPTPTTEMVKDSLGNMVEKPKYGGTLTIVTQESGGLDPCIYNTMDVTGRDLIFEYLCTPDWKRGPFGTKEHSYSGYADPQFYTGCIAESWEMPDTTTVIFHIRQGIHWQDREPVNGREVVADDVVYSIICHNNAPLGAYPTPPTEVYAEGKYTVVVKLANPDPTAIWTLNNQYYIFPPEVKDYSTYKNVVGTGAYLLTDFISGTSATLTRNPEYWKYDPLLPENKLPYINEIKQLCIVDQSIQLAGLRTNVVDILWNVQWQQVDSLKSTNPYLQMTQSPGLNCMILSLRNDTKPFDNIKVRRALSMAINREAILEGYYGGAGEIFNWPVQQSSTGCYTPLDEMPADVQENYSYNPEMARQLLSEAGVTDLTINTIVLPAPAYYQEVMSLVVDFWSQIGVKGKIEVVEAGPFWNQVRAWEYQSIHTLFGNSNPHSGVIRYYDPGLWLNWSRVDDPYINERRIELLTTIDPVKRNQVMKEAAIYEASQCWVIELPKPSNYIYWQPWVKRYEGIYGHFFRYFETYPYVWIDQNNKAKYVN
jgi:peptide/nickel transport system substrate-binding protein